MRYKLHNCRKMSATKCRAYFESFLAQAGNDWAGEYDEYPSSTNSPWDRAGQKWWGLCEYVARGVLPEVEDWQQLHSMALALVVAEPESWTAHALLEFSWEGWRRAQWGNPQQ